MLLKENTDEIFLITIFVIIDDSFSFLQKLSRFNQLPGIKNTPGPESKLNMAELMSIAIFKFKFSHRNWKDYYSFICKHYAPFFPNLPDYSTFMKQLKMSLPTLLILTKLFQYIIRMYATSTKIVDSTPLRVCKNSRISSHKVCKGIAARSKTTTGWFFGFKLHACCDSFGQLLSFMITPGNIDDRRIVKSLLKQLKGLVIADAGYLSKLLREDLEHEGIQLFTAVRNTMKKLMTNFQHQLLKSRQRIETVFSILKERMGIETSLFRSVIGHFTHYAYTCFAYMLMYFNPKILLTC